MTEQEKRGNLEQRQEIGSYVKHTIGAWDNNRWLFELKDEYVQSLQQFLGKHAELVVDDVMYTAAGEDTTDRKITWLSGKITLVNSREIQLLVDSGEIEYSDSIERRKIDQGVHSIQFGSGYSRSKIVTGETKLKKLIVDDKNVLPEEERPQDRWQGIETDSRLLLQRIEELLGSVRLGKALVFTYWSADSDRWVVIQSSGIDENEIEILNLTPNSHDLTVKKAPYWYWSMGKTSEATRSDEYNWRYERFGLGVTIQPDGSLKAVDFVRGRHGYVSLDLQKLSGSIDAEVFIGYLCNSTLECLQEIITRLEREESE